MSFNPDTFLTQETDAQLETEFVPCPAGEYQGSVDKVRPRKFTIDNEERAVLDISWLILDLDGKIEAETGMERNVVQQTLWLDVNEQGALETGKGKNIGLGKLREALGQNKSGKKWSPGMLMGQGATVVVSEYIDKEENPRAQIKKVLPL